MQQFLLYFLLFIIFIAAVSPRALERISTKNTKVELDRITKHKFSSLEKWDYDLLNSDKNHLEEFKNSNNVVNSVNAVNAVNVKNDFNSMDSQHKISHDKESTKDNIELDFEDAFFPNAIYEANTSCPTAEELCATPPVNWSDWQIYAKLVGTVVLVGMSGFCAGMTTGFFSLDMNSLSIIAKSDPNKKNRKYAKKIIPVRRNGNLLLVTLILTNVFVNSAISILSADLTSGLLGFFLSSALIVVFGEIFPQALCVKYTLFIGSTTVYFVYAFMFFLFPLAYPFSALLDFILGKDLGQFYDVAGLKELIDIHAKSGEKTGLEFGSANILHGALDFANKKVKDVMTTQENIFWVEASAKLDAELLNSIWQTGHSRIPVYMGSKDNIVGILFVKDLIVLSPDDELPLSTVLLFYGKEPLRVDPEMPLSDMFQKFKTSRSHLAIVQEAKENEEGLDSSYSVIGLITLEDVIEEIIRDEIVDESDVYVSNLQNERVLRRDDPNYSFKRGLTKRLTPTQIQTISQFLERSSRYFRMLPPDYMKQLLGKSRIESIKSSDNNPSLYRKGESVEHFSLILTGKIEVTSSEEGFVTYLGPWSMIGIKALIQKDYISDFNARAIEDITVLKIYKQDFVKEVRELFEHDESFFLPQEMSWIDDTATSVNDIQINLPADKDNETLLAIPKSPSSISNLSPKPRKGLAQLKSTSQTTLLIPEDDSIKTASDDGIVDISRPRRKSKSYSKSDGEENTKLITDIPRVSVTGEDEESQ